MEKAEDQDFAFSICHCEAKCTLTKHIETTQDLKEIKIHFCETVQFNFSSDFTTDNEIILTRRKTKCGLEY